MPGRLKVGRPRLRTRHLEPVQPGEYRLHYKEPYEYRGRFPIDIGWEERTHDFSASSDEKAREIVEEFVSRWTLRIKFPSVTHEFRRQAINLETAKSRNIDLSNLQGEIKMDDHHEFLQYIKRLTMAVSTGKTDRETVRELFKEFLVTGDLTEEQIARFDNAMRIEE